MFSATPFYFSTIRNLIAAFGSLFSGVGIRRINSDGSIAENIKVPLSYAPADKTVIMLQQRNPNITDNKVDIKTVLPRMSYELTGINYDPTRKTQTINQDLFVPVPSVSFNSVTAVDNINGTINVPNHGLETGRIVVYFANGGTVLGNLVDEHTYYVYKVDANNIKLCQTFDMAVAGGTILINSVGDGTIQTLTSSYGKQYNSVPYDFEFTVYLFVKYIDDGLQIVEQIVPYFTPFYTITMNDVKAYGVSKDVTVTLNSIASEDQFQGGDIEEDRIITWTLTFTAKGWVYPPVMDSVGVIKISDVNFYQLGEGQKLTTTRVEVDPFTAEETDPYVIETSITDYTQ